MDRRSGADIASVVAIWVNWFYLGFGCVCASGVALSLTTDNRKRGESLCARLVVHRLHGQSLGAL
jgi:hypothetical protein